MKRLIFTTMLILTAGLFVACQKEEQKEEQKAVQNEGYNGSDEENTDPFSFYGTWQAVGTYSYEDKNGNLHRDVYTIELTLDQKGGSASWVKDYPNDPYMNVNRTGTYTYHNENTMSVKFPETKDDDEWVFLLYRDNEDDSRIYGADHYFTKINKGANAGNAESFFNGTWQAVGTYQYEDKNGNLYRDVYTVELTLDKKESIVSWTEDYPNDKMYNVNRTGTYTYHNKNTVSVTLLETRDDDERVFLLSKDGNRIWGGGYEFTKVKNQ